MTASCRTEFTNAFVFISARPKAAVFGQNLCDCGHVLMHVGHRSRLTCSLGLVQPTELQH